MPTRHYTLGCGIDDIVTKPRKQGSSAALALPLPPQPERGFPAQQLLCWTGACNIGRDEGQGGAPLAQPSPVCKGAETGAHPMPHHATERVFLLFLHCLLCVTAAAPRTSPLGVSESCGAHTLPCTDCFMLVDQIESRTKALISLVFQNRSNILHPVEAENKGVVSSFAIAAFCLSQCWAAALLRSVTSGTHRNRWALAFCWVTAEITPDRFPCISGWKPGGMSWSACSFSLFSLKHAQCQLYALQKGCGCTGRWTFVTVSGSRLCCAEDTGKAWHDGKSNCVMAIYLSSI